MAHTPFFTPQVTSGNGFAFEKIVGEGITFDDVLLVPARSNFVPRVADVSTRFTRNIASVTMDLNDTEIINFNAQGGAPPKGQVEYNNHTDKTAYHSLSITSVMIEPTTCTTTSSPGQKATIEGTMQKKGTQGSLGFTMIVEDCGEPGRNDTFSIVITDGETRSGVLDKGNIQVH